MGGGDGACCCWKLFCLFPLRPNSHSNIILGIIVINNAAPIPNWSSICVHIAHQGGVHFILIQEISRLTTLYFDKKCSIIKFFFYSKVIFFFWNSPLILKGTVPQDILHFSESLMRNTCHFPLYRRLTKGIIGSLREFRTK